MHLEQVDQIFRDSKNIFDPPKMAKRLPIHALVDTESTAERTQKEQTESVE
jgi:hypothetical protein